MSPQWFNCVFISLASGGEEVLFLWHCPNQLFFGVLGQIPQELRHPKLGLDRLVTSRAEKESLRGEKQLRPPSPGEQRFPSVGNPGIQSLPRSIKGSDSWPLPGGRDFPFPLPGLFAWGRGPGGLQTWCQGW